MINAQSQHLISAGSLHLLMQVMPENEAPIIRLYAGYLVFEMSADVNP